MFRYQRLPATLFLPETIVLHMIYKMVFFLAVSLILYSCTDRGPKHSTDQKAVIINKILSCYEYIGNQDTISLKTINVDGFITGTLVYHLHQKNKSKGTIQGRMDGNKLIADYTCQSAGNQSIRMIAFQKTDNGYTEGYGETKKINGRTVFTNLGSLRFADSPVLKIKDCGN
jgi:hypothetical protein